jgi:ceramide glucosyltransferase
VDAKLLVGSDYYGPNPKINNLAKGYEQARYDILWVLDSNVWVSAGALRRSIDTLNQSPNIQLVHHLPMCLSSYKGLTNNLGAKIDEAFMLTSHSKFYTAINAIGLAPCVMGKSNIYRRSALDKAAGNAPKGHGIRKFAQYIAEDNMIASELWKLGGRTAMTEDSAVQPLGRVSLKGYWDRRVRWLRVRRYMVMAATLVEPTTESILSGIFGSFAVAQLFLNQNWSFAFFSIHILFWCLVDYWNFHNLLAFNNVDHQYGNVPTFATKYY